jgi:hypothetical protein
MAFLVAFTPPTVSIGCWSGSFLVFSSPTSLSWIMLLFKKSCGPKLQLLCTIVNAFTLLWLIVITGLDPTNAISNCYCNTTWMMYPHFIDFAFIGEYFNIIVPWAVACSIGFTIACVVLLLSIVGGCHATISRHQLRVDGKQYPRGRTSC